LASKNFLAPPKFLGWLRHWQYGLQQQEGWALLVYGMGPLDISDTVIQLMYRNRPPHLAHQQSPVGCNV